MKSITNLEENVLSLLLISLEGIVQSFICPGI